MKIYKSSFLLSHFSISILSFLSSPVSGSWVLTRVWLLCGSICGFDWFVGLWVLAWFVGISVVVLWVSTCGCAVVHGYQRGSICLISVKLCYGLIFDLVWLFFLFFFLLWLVVAGWEVEEEAYWGMGFFFFFFPCYCGLWLWLVGATVEVVDAIVLFIIILMSYLYYFKWVAKNIESLMLSIL